MMIDLHLILEHQGEVGCGGEHFQIDRGLKGTKQIYKLGIFKYAWVILGQVRVLEVIDRLNCGGSEQILK